MTEEIIRNYRIDASRVYVAGLSAGGAMAAVMGATYPELYAAVGIRSGLPYGAAHDMPSAFGVMKDGSRKPGSPGAHGRVPPPEHTIPVIVFHGDRDTTVHPGNGDQALAQWVPAFATQAKADNLHGAQVEKGQVPKGHAYTRTVLHGENGEAIAEHWVVHGAGHAWSGGSSHGTYTDPHGPSASREMVRFFFSQRQNAR